MKIIFLDIDGVVLAGRHLWSPSGFVAPDGRHIAKGQDRSALPADTVSLVLMAVQATGAQLVLSSSWRLHRQARDHMAAATLAPFHPDWCTDSNDGNGLPVRGAQIQRWLDAHPDVTSYAILDDDSDMLPSQMPFFVKTNHYKGLTKGDLYRLIAILGTQAAAPLGLQADMEALP